MTTYVEAVERIATINASIKALEAEKKALEAVLKPTLESVQGTTTIIGNHKVVVMWRQTVDVDSLTAGEADALREAGAVLNARDADDVDLKAGCSKDGLVQVQLAHPKLYASIIAKARRTMTYRISEVKN